MAPSFHYRLHGALKEKIRKICAYFIGIQLPIGTSRTFSSRSESRIENKMFIRVQEVVGFLCGEVEVSDVIQRIRSEYDVNF